jgi:hypothetical protein
MIKNIAEWNDWFQKQRNRCKEYQKKKLDESVELKIAVKETKFQDAESIVLGILGDEKMGVFHDFMP